MKYQLFSRLLAARNSSAALQATTYSTAAWPQRFVGSSLFARNASSDASLQKEINDEGFKGHDMLAPFTAGWQSTDLHPLVIAKSEGSYVYDTNGKKYLDSLAGLWCTSLGIQSMLIILIP